MKTLRDGNGTVDSVRTQRPTIRLLFLVLPLGFAFLLLIAALVGGAPDDSGH